jgi:F-type H+-transporting ATPase subunit b
MPQLDVATFVPQLFWLAVTFVVLLILMRGMALPRVGAAIDARRRRLDDDLAEAARMKAEADTALAAYERSLADARAQAQATIKETSDRLAAEAAERQRLLGLSLAEGAAAAERQIVAAKERALADIRGIAVEAAAAVAAKVIGAAVDPRRVEAAVAGVMAGREA